MVRVRRVLMTANIPVDLAIAGMLALVTLSALTGAAWMRAASKRER